MAHNFEQLRRVEREREIQQHIGRPERGLRDRKNPFECYAELLRNMGKTIEEAVERALVRHFSNSDATARINEVPRPAPPPAVPAPRPAPAVSAVPPPVDPVSATVEVPSDDVCL
ncbi:serine/arginine repetitive matrix protein 1-like [Lytechinus variegatus]|uniref:serine/arginine repetitive matrix protein 1-like n=1 Tax=Lytechinus variegatus TaxID=7654 RepID=UPI001BB24D92|nr:serine/arginine repetitive matrix protein 1-like [Lytechinus variegatus]